MEIQSNIVAEIAITYKNKVALSKRLKIETSLHAHEIVRTRFDKNTIHIYEELHVLYLNRANKIIGTYHASKGGTSATIVDVKLILSIALKCLAASIIVAHNHPSGVLSPSNEDILITGRLKEAGKLVDVYILDHLILSPEEGYYSFADMGHI